MLRTASIDRIQIDDASLVVGRLNDKAMQEFTDDIYEGVEVIPLTLSTINSLNPSSPT